MRLSVLLLVITTCIAFAFASETNQGNKDDVSTSPRSNEKKVAIVTLLTTKSYIPGVLVLAESLNQVNAKGDRVLLWVGHEDDPRSDLSAEDIAYLSQYWNTKQLSKKDGTYTACQISELHKQAIAANPKMVGLERYWGTCSKFAVWTLDEYDVVAYMDADSFALANFDFVFDYLDADPEDAAKGIPTYSFAAHAVPECWTSDPPQCDNFYSAFMVIKPLPHIHQYFHQVAGQQFLAEGEITLLNQVINHWKPLPRFTLVAQTETVRPTNPQTGLIDWSTGQAKVYDFAGSPETKPWMSHKLAKQHKNPNWHAYFGPMQPGTEGHARYQIPQILWNEHYDRLLEREEREGVVADAAVKDNSKTQQKEEL